jgi:hypothetical protein
MVSAMRMTTTAPLLVLMMLIAAAPAADARGGHGFRRGGLGHGGSGLHGIHGGRAMDGAGGAGALAGDRRRADDAYVSSASDEEDRLLNSKIKSICRGC